MKAVYMASFVTMPLRQPLRLKKRVPWSRGGQRGAEQRTRDFVSTAPEKKKKKKKRAPRRALDSGAEEMASRKRSVEEALGLSHGGAPEKDSGATRLESCFEDILGREAADVSVAAVEDIRLRCERALTGGVLKGAKCVIFGSQRTGLVTKGSDIDICVVDIPELSRLANKKRPDEQKIKKLRKRLIFVAKVRLQKCFGRVLALAMARVPVIKAVDSQTGLCVDVVLENRDGIGNSEAIREVVLKDASYRDFLLLVKVWSKRRDVSDPATLANYGHTILGIHTLLRELTVYSGTKAKAALPFAKKNDGGEREKNSWRSSSRTSAIWPATSTGSTRA